MMSLLQPPSQSRHSDSGQMVAKLLPGIFIEILATPRSDKTLAGITIHRNAKLVKVFLTRIDAVVVDLILFLLLLLLLQLLHPDVPGLVASLAPGCQTGLSLKPKSKQN